VDSPYNDAFRLLVTRALPPVPAARAWGVGGVLQDFWRDPVLLCLHVLPWAARANSVTPAFPHSTSLPISQPRVVQWATVREG
jgi:hypothetical protein